MNTTTTLTAAAILTLAAGLASGQGFLGGPEAESAERPARQLAGEREQRPEHRRGDRRRGHGMDRAAFLERFDTDADGELSDAEKTAAKEELKAEHEAKRTEMKARLLARFDDNANGELDEDEKAAIKELMGHRLRERGQREGGRRGEGRLGEGRRQQMHKRALEQFDANNDGTLSDDEKAVARAHFEQKKAEIVARFDADGDGELTGEEREAARAHHREQRMLDVNRDGRVDTLDVQTITERAAGGERLPDVNRDGLSDAKDAAALIERIGSFED